MPVSLRLPEDLNQRLSILAAQTGRSKTFYMLEAIKQQIDELEDLYLAEQRLIEIRSGKSKTVPLEEVAKSYCMEGQKGPSMKRTPNATTQAAMQEASQVIKSRRERQA